MTRDELLETLGATPDRVERLAHGLSAAQLTRRPSEREWSMAETLNHLLGGERDVIFPRLQRMLLEGAPKFPSSTTSRTGFAAEPTLRDFGEDLAAFSQARNRTIAFLKGLGQRDWQRNQELTVPEVAAEHRVEVVLDRCLTADVGAHARRQMQRAAQDGGVRLRGAQVELRGDRVVEDVSTGRLIEGAGANVTGDSGAILTVVHRLAHILHRKMTGADIAIDGEGADKTDSTGLPAGNRSVSAWSLPTEPGNSPDAVGGKRLPPPFASACLRHTALSSPGAGSAPVRFAPHTPPGSYPPDSSAGREPQTPRSPLRCRPSPLLPMSSRRQTTTGW